MGERAGAEPRYTAFLSYSHKDAAAGGRLHRRLEAYRLPKRLVGAETARGIVPDRLWPIFRDREELPAATDLSETVREALAQSGSLIVLCSPHAAQSLWVAEEIETFRRLHPDRPILAAVLDGDPPDCFPAALRAFGRDGTWHEPLATDLRRGRDGAHLGLLKLIAGITGVGLDALVQRDAARRIRRVTGVTVAAMVAMLIMAALAWIAFDARREAERQRAEAEGMVEFMLTDLRERLRAVGRISIMTAVNRRALAYYGDQDALDGLSADSLERRARILQAMGDDYVRGDNFAAARAAFREAYRTTEEQLTRSPDDPHRIFAHSQSEYWVGFIDYQQGNYQAARPPFQRYRLLAGRLYRIDPRNLQWVRESAYAEGNMCSVLLEAPVDARGALRSCTSALARIEQIRAAVGTAPQVIEDLGNRHAWLARAWRANGRPDRALHHWRRYAAFARTLTERDPENNDYRDVWVRAQLTIGEAMLDRSDWRAAATWLSDAETTLAPMLRHDPENATWRSLQQRITRARARLGGGTMQ